MSGEKRAIAFFIIEYPRNDHTVPTPAANSRSAPAASNSLVQANSCSTLWPWRRSKSASRATTVSSPPHPGRYLLCTWSMRKSFAVFLLRANLSQSDRSPRLEAFEKPAIRNVRAAHPALCIDTAVSPESESPQRHRFGRFHLQRQAVLASSNHHAKWQSELPRRLLNLRRAISV